MSFENENNPDPRNRLVREKYFNVRPKPLERWLWSQGIPASAERVFWLHWQEGMQRGDWCSELPLRYVARECQLDVSTITRAYQLLIRLGCLRRTDPGRDPANPFQQATALTEVRVPRELLLQWERFPNRRLPASRNDRGDEEGTEGSSISHASPSAETRTDLTDCSSESTASADPLVGLHGRERVRALAQLTQEMSAREQYAYQEAMRMHRSHMEFDEGTRVPPEARARVLMILSAMATALPAPGPARQAGQGVRAQALSTRPHGLSRFELARLQREIQALTSTASAPELMRQVVWSIEAGSLQRFNPLHALNIALKKIREGRWTRPHRMPPQWAMAPGGVGSRSRPGTCRTA